MKKYIILLLVVTAIFSLTSCLEDKSVDPTIMPEVTTEGKQTFGCLIDGWVYVGGRYYALFSPKRDSFQFCYNVEEDWMEVSVLVSKEEYLSFIILHPREGETVNYISTAFGIVPYPDGQVHISRFDRELRIISGTFGDGERISHGRFDVKY